MKSVRYCGGLLVAFALGIGVAHGVASLRSTPPIVRAIVVGHVDGDTLKISRMGPAESVRLWGVNAIERGRRGWEPAARRLAEILPEGTIVDVQFLGRSRFSKSPSVLVHSQKRSVAQQLIDEKLVEAGRY